MKKRKIIGYFRFLSGINLSRVENKNVRSAVISNHLMMYRIVQQHDEDIKELQKKLFEGKEEEITALNNLREEYKTAEAEARKNEIVGTIMNDYKDLLQLESEFTAAINEKLDEDVNISLKKISQDEFVDVCFGAGIDITPADLIELEELLETNN